MRYTEYHYGKAVIKDKTKLSEALDKLASYENAENEKRLFISPCALGDSSYWISDSEINGERIHEDIITGIAISPEGYYIWCPRDRDFNKVGTRFALLSREEAEKMLYEIVKYENLVK